MRIWAAITLAALAGGCAAPFIDGRREAGQQEPVGLSTPDLVAVCYPGGDANAPGVRSLADQECAKSGMAAAFDRETAWTCTLTAPHHAYFRCGPKS